MGEINAWVLRRWVTVGPHARRRLIPEYWSGPKPSWMRIWTEWTIRIEAAATFATLSDFDRAWTNEHPLHDLPPQDPYGTKLAIDGEIYAVHMRDALDDEADEYFNEGGEAAAKRAASARRILHEAVEDWEEESNWFDGWRAWSHASQTRTKDKIREIGADILGDMQPKSPAAVPDAALQS